MIGIFFGILLLILAFLIYRPTLRRNRLLFLIRVFLMLIILLIVSGFNFTFRFPQKPKTKLLLLVDISQSMADKIEELKRITEELRSELKIPPKAILGFSDTLFPISDFRFPISDFGARTNITKALEASIKKRPGSVLIISDGQHNLGPDPVKYAEQLHFPVHTIGLGKKTLRNLEIRSIRKPEQVFENETLEAIVRIKSIGFNQENVIIRLKDDDSVIDKKEIALPFPESELEIIFRNPIKKVGSHQFKVVADSLSNEENYDDNLKNFSLKVLSSKIKVFYFTNRPSFNTRFLISALSSEPDLEVKPLVAWMPDASRLMPHGYDILILDNLDFRKLKKEDINAILNYHQAGGSILLLLGEGSSLVKDLETIFPLIPQNEVIRADFFPRLSEEGSKFGFLQPAFFNNLPPLWGIVKTQNIRPQTKVLIVSEPRELPLMAYSFDSKSKAKVLQITGFPLWRWAFFENDLALENFKDFLKQILKFLTLKEVRRFKLVTDKLDYYTGEKITFTLYAYKETGEVFKGLDGELRIKKNHKVIEKLPFFEVADGIYETYWEATDTGHLKASAVLSSETNQIVGETETGFNVSSISVELLKKTVDEELLKALSEKTGGAYFALREDLGNWQEILETLKKLPHSVPLKREIPHSAFHFAPFKNPWTYIIFLLFFSLELYLRKKQGLA